MSRNAESPAVVIQRRHQSAPKTHWIDEEVRKAAVEIDEGRYVADESSVGVLDKLGISLGLGSGGVAKGEMPTLEDFRATRELNQLGRHPRVLEALERLQQETDDGKTPEEAIERQWRMHEMNAASVEHQKWEGQGRWEGEENEEMRVGRVLTPQGFHAQLCTVIGTERVLLSPHAVKQNFTDKSARCGLYVKNPLWTGARMGHEYKQVKAQELRRAGMENFHQARKLRAAGLNALADNKFEVAAEAAQAATEILMEMSAEEQTNPELLRVGTLQWPLGTEWMCMHFNEYGVPTEAKFLGWRTALLTMIRCKAITEAEAHQAFPLVAENRAAQWYLQQLYWLRNPKIQVH